MGPRLSLEVPCVHVKGTHRAIDFPRAEASMSKAFTSEENDDVAPLVAPPPVLRPGEKRFITPAGARALEQRLEALRARRAALSRTVWSMEEQARALDAAVDALARTLAVLTVATPPAADDPHVVSVR